MREEPRIDARQLADALETPARSERIGHLQQPIGPRHAQILRELRGALLVERQAGHGREAIETRLETAQRLLQRLLERATDRHHLAHRFHLRGESIVGALEFLEREARDLGDDVIDGRLEGGRSRATGDVVAQLIERVAHGELGCDFGDREAGCFRGQRRGARHARVHLDHDQPPVLRVDGELHVRATRVDADLAQHRDRGIAHALVFLVRQGLRGCHRDRITRVHAHRIEILDRADDDAVVGAIAHDLHLEFLPAEHRLLDQHLVGGRRIEAARNDRLELLAVVGDAAARAAERERGSDYAGEPKRPLDGERLLERVRDRSTRRFEPDLAHGIAEELTILGHIDRFARGADELDAILLEHALTHEIERRVERGLAAHRRQHRIRALLLDDARHGAPVDRLDVGGIGHAGVGHDRGRVRVDQDDAVAFLAQCLAGLCTGVVELAGLTDDDRTRADDQDAVDVCSLGHGRS